MKLFTIENMKKEVKPGTAQLGTFSPAHGAARLGAARPGSAAHKKAPWRAGHATGRG